MIVDVAVHPVMPDDAYRERLPSPWTEVSNLLPKALGKTFEAAFPLLNDPQAASDADAMADLLFGRLGIDLAVLTPPTRGLLPNPQHAATVARVTNEWLYERWLTRDARFFGSIRLAVTHPKAALEEIERWAAEPRFVQVAVPLRALAQYGDEQYFPIWESATAHELPVYVYDDPATAGELVRSAVGQPMYFAEVDAVRSMLSIVHLASLLMSGVVNRLPKLRFIFGDGGIDVAHPLLWRLDNDWRGSRVEVPWAEDLPSAAALTVARFVSQAHDGTADGHRRSAELARISKVESQLLFGSHVPFWDDVTAATVGDGWPAATRTRVLAANALEVMPRLARAPAVVSDARGV